MKNRIKEKLSRRQGLSTIELLCAVGIVLVLAAAIFIVAQVYAEKSARGNDRLAMETAKSIATTNIHKGDVFSHGNGEDFPQRGYFDPITHTIVKECPKGYNDSAVVTSADGTLYSGAPHSLVICVEYDGENVDLFWTEAKK